MLSWELHPELLPSSQSMEGKCPLKRVTFGFTRYDILVTSVVIQTRRLSLSFLWPMAQCIPGAHPVLSHFPVGKGALSQCEGLRRGGSDYGAFSLLICSNFSDSKNFSGHRAMTFFGFCFSKSNLLSSPTDVQF